MADGYTSGSDGAAPLIAGTFSVDLSRPLLHAGGGLPAFVAHDQRGSQRPLMAIPVAGEAQARPQFIQTLSANPPSGLLAPLGHGEGSAPGGGTSYYVVGHAPPGPPLVTADAARQAPWSEAELLSCLLRPVATALELLQARGLTHRAIRPQNVFRAGAGEAAVLGAGWSVAVADRRRALYEPPYVGICVPGGAGEGLIADDVYALGVTLLVLALGHEPLAGLDQSAIVQRKLEQGSFHALVGDERLSPVVADLVRGLLAEDPDHRPPPALLSDPIAARGRRVAARPRRRAQRPLQIGGLVAWDTRMLAFALASDPEHGVRLLRSNQVDQWLRRSLGESVLAGRLDEYVRLHVADGPGDARAEAMLLMRLIAQLDPLAPLCWRGIALWPDGLGGAIAVASGDGGTTSGHVEKLTEVVRLEAIGDWASMRPERSEPARLRQEARQAGAILRQRGWSGGLSRLVYTLNPMLACRGKLLAGRCVVRATDLLPALDAVAAAPERRVGLPIDREIAAFLLARHERRLEGEVAALGETADPDAASLATLRLFAPLQSRLRVAPLPHLAAWIAERASSAQARSWRRRRRRAETSAAVADLVGAGDLAALLAVIDDPTARLADEREGAAAAAIVGQIDVELAQIAASGPSRAEAARRLGGEVAASIGLAALAVTGVIAAVAP